MMRHWPTLVAFFGGLCLGIALDNHAALCRSETKNGTGVEKSLGALRADVEVIKDRLPDQAHAMQDVANQFTNVWFAEAQRHWELANFYLGETRNHLRWAVRIIPKRKDKAGREVDLPRILEAMENGPLKQLESAVKSKDAEHFVAAYKFSLENCYACHKASDKPYLRVQIPTQPAVRIINFDPNAKWPL
jgi:hypothetical protein